MSTRRAQPTRRTSALGGPCSHLLPCLGALRLYDRDAASIGGTGKKKIDGEYANTRLKSQISDGWANERFRQCMVIVREYANEWPNETFLTSDDVQWIRICLDVALASGIRANHVADEYDSNATTWSILLIQHTKATRTGGWKTESERVQELWSFEHLYEFIRDIAARGEQRNLYDRDGKRIARYRVPFKVMNVPPRPHHMYRFVKAARRLSEWLYEGGLPPLAQGIVRMKPPELVAAPPQQAAREQRRQAMWSRVAAKANGRPLASVTGNGEDAALTREMINSVVRERGAASSSDAEQPGEVMDDADLEHELQREMEVQEVVRKLQAPPTAPGEAGPSQAPPGGAGQPPVIRDNADLDGILAFLMSD